MPRAYRFAYAPWDSVHLDVAHTRPLTRRDLAVFNLRVTLPMLWRIVRQALGRRAAVRAFAALAWRSRRDPLAEVPTSGWPAEEEILVRDQLRPILVLDDVLRRDFRLADDRRLELLREIVSHSGARFVEHVVPEIAPADWAGATPAQRREVQRTLVGRFFNARAEHGEPDERSLRFDVTACRFAQLVRALDRPYLANMFCEADAVYFGQPSSPIRLTRKGTIADGAPRCDFLFTLRDASPE